MPAGVRHRGAVPYYHRGQFVARSASPKQNTKKSVKGRTAKTGKVAQKAKELSPWAIREFPKRGDSSKRITYAAVGEALSEWTEIEISMTKIFFTFLEGKGGYELVAIRAFGSVRTFEGRYEMLRSAAEAYFEIEKDRFKRANDPNSSIAWVENIQKELDKICKELKEFVSRRNEIAHGLVSPMFGKLIAKRTFALQPAPMDKKSNIYSFPLYVYDSKVLRYYASHFKRLSEKLHLANIKIRHIRDRVPL